MRSERIKVSGMELSILAAILFLLAVPLYLKFSQGWAPWEARGSVQITIVRTSASKGDALRLEEYSIEGLAHNHHGHLLARSTEDNSFDLNNSGIKIVDDTRKGILDFDHSSSPAPIHSFNEKIMLVTGQRTTDVEVRP